jgi:prolyl-tRNA editing enzyme YbaK/EbsC (Cys-tRNA(Pro) deacylase)
MADDAPGVIDLQRRGIDHRIIHPGHVTSVEEAAQACGVRPEQVVKTLVVRRGEDDYVLVLVPGDRSLSWPKLRALLGVSRISLPDAEEALAATGYARGTITPTIASSAGRSPWARVSAIPSSLSRPTR